MPDIVYYPSWKVPPIDLPRENTVVTIAVSLGKDQGIFRSIGWWDGVRWFTPGCCEIEQIYFDSSCSESSVVAWQEMKGGEDPKHGQNNGN